MFAPGMSFTAARMASTVSKEVCFLSFFSFRVLLGLAESLPLLFLAMFFFAVGDSFRTGTHKSVMLDWADRTNPEGGATRLLGITRFWSKLSRSGMPGEPWLVLANPPATTLEPWQVEGAHGSRLRLRPTRIDRHGDAPFDGQLVEGRPERVAGEGARHGIELTGVDRVRARHRDPLGGVRAARGDARCRALRTKRPS